FNSSALKYIHIDLPSDEVGKVPQVLLVTREIIFKKGEKKNTYKVLNEKEYLRLEGYDEIKNFTERKVNK
ncbi:MAG: hypothetical protein ABJM22_13950, partial [Balneola sp.]